MEAKSIKAATVNSLQAVKRNCGKSYGQIAAETGLTNVYVAQLFRRQAQLNPDTAPKLRSALPELPEDLLQEMMRPPVRSYDPNLIQDPTVYRLNEAIMHFGESIKEIINEEFGDGIMSAIDFYCSVDKVKGVDGKDRVVLTFDGKYLPYTEQKTEHMVSRSRLQGRADPFMTDSAAVTRTSQEYLDALRATQLTTADQDPSGFVDPQTVGNKHLSAIIKQNNFLVQITTTILRKLNELEEQVQRIEQQVARIEQGKAKVELPDNTVQQLIKEFKGGAALAVSSSGKKKEVAPIQAYKSPYIILKEEQDKLLRR